MIDYRRIALCVTAGAALWPLAGCRISHHGSVSGKDVDIDVPFASMHVKTAHDADVAGIGLTTYPGAVAVKDNDHKDNDNAAVDLNFGDFHLGVKAAEYQTADSPEKVEAFYRQDMARFGDVLTCLHNHAQGEPSRTAQGLTCNDDETNHHNHIRAQVEGEKELQLRAGSPAHQHIVGIESKDGGTRIGLVMLDLPRDLHGHHGGREPE